MPATLDLRRGQITGDASRRWIDLNTLSPSSVAATYAPLASPVFTGDPQAPTPAPGDNDTSVATTAYVQSQGGQLPATATNDNAAAGKVGEVISAVQGSAQALPTATAVNVTSVSLTAGDWDVSGEIWFLSGSGSIQMYAAINTVSAAVPGSPALGTAFTAQTVAGTGVSIGVEILPVGPCQASLATTTTYYLVAQQTGGTGMQAVGKIMARRAR